MKLINTPSGIFELMDDLGKGLESGESILLGGGNPVFTDCTFDFFGDLLVNIGRDRSLFSKAVQSYTEPKGYLPLRKNLAAYFNKKFNWSISEENICMTNGMQNGFHILLNFLTTSFRTENGRSDSFKQILCPKLPDYIGYFDTIAKERFSGQLAEEKMVDDISFNYTIDFEMLEKKMQAEESGRNKNETAALLVSSPGNPSSAILSKEEIDQLVSLTEKYGRYLIFDHAYGNPFPNIFYQDSPNFPFNSHTIHCYSFSKLGLPGLRMGCIIGPEEVINKISVANGIQVLSPSSFNAVLLNQVWERSKDGSPNMDDYCKKLHPIYVKRKELAVETIRPYLQQTPAKIHQVQGGFFLWLKLPGLNFTSKQIYQQLKELGVVVVPGEYFYVEVKNPNPHIRISFTVEEEKLVNGLKLIGEWLKKVYQQM